MVSDTFTRSEGITISEKPNFYISLISKFNKMNKLKLTLLIAFAAIGTISFAQTRLTLHPEDAETKINKEIYGHFAEHLGRCIYGGIYVGEDSEIPNVRGFRDDVIGALKDMQIPLLRWPGGCFADTYHWKDGIGPREERPSIVNVHWGGVTEDNSFGTHEFLDFCDLIEAEPYINLNVGSGTVQEASEWVEYVTSSNLSPMTELRKKNGRDKPWDVKYWGIGNENWGCGGRQNTTPIYTTALPRIATGIYTALPEAQMWPTTTGWKFLCKKLRGTDIWYRVFRCTIIPSQPHGKIKDMLPILAKKNGFPF